MPHARSLGCRRLGTTLAILAATSIAGLGARSAAAHVPPQWYVNEFNMHATHEHMLTDATNVDRVLVTNSVLGEIKCVGVAESVNWNEGGHGYAEVLNFTTANCQAPKYVKEAEEQDHANIERWIAEHGEGKEPTSPVHCAASESKPGEGKCLTAYITTELPPEANLREGEICSEPAFGEGETLQQCREAGATEARSVISSVARRTSSLPWKAELVDGARVEEEELREEPLLKVGLAGFGEAGTATAQSTKCYPKEGERMASFRAVPSGCVVVNVVIPQIPQESVLYGTQELVYVNGSKSGLFGSNADFTEAGSLFSSEGVDGSSSMGNEGVLDVRTTAEGLPNAKCEKEPGKFEEC